MLGMANQITEKQSYCNTNGKYQKEADILAKSVPIKGESFDTRVELFRCASNIYYDMFNNGMMNCTESGSRRDEYDYVASKIDIGFVENFMEVYQEEQDQDPDVYDNSESESMYAIACDAMDLVMDRVIERIIKTGYFNEVHN